jgi:hypothetical protein
VGRGRQGLGRHGQLTREAPLLGELESEKAGGVAVLELSRQRAQLAGVVFFSTWTIMMSPTTRDISHVHRPRKILQHDGA